MAKELDPREGSVAPPSSRRGPPSTERVPPQRRRWVGPIELRLTTAVVIMAVLPFVMGVAFAVRLIKRATDIYVDPRIGKELEAALDVYRPLVRALKYDMKHRADAMAAREPLRAAAILRDAKEVQVELEDAFIRYGDKLDPVTNDPPLIELVSLQVFTDLELGQCIQEFAVGTGPSGPGDAGRPPEPKPVNANAHKYTSLALVKREAPLNPQRDYALVQCKPLGTEDGTTMLVATFATERARIDHLHEADEFVAFYRELERGREEWVRLNFSFFAALLAGTILLAAAVGFAFARSVSRRVSRVADAAKHVAGGDLEVRVPEEGGDEIGDLAIAFNRMLREVERSRARVEYLQRVGAWQDMARRLAHEIKNPLTPIQLAVEECHSKYGGEDPKMRKLLDSTLEIVTEEVGTLRRLVSEFSDFARLPPAKLSPEDLGALLREVQSSLERLGLGTEPGDLMLTPSGGQAIPVKVTVDPVVATKGEADATILVAVDRQMIRKALDNVARNAVQAIRASGKGYRVLVHALVLDDARIAIDVDDDGPGVPEDARARIFDPYFTTRTEGTGLGLAIVKKIVIEHGGTITCDVSPLKGARFRILLPPLDSAESRAAVEASQRNVETRPPEG